MTVFHMGTLRRTHPLFLLALAFMLAACVHQDPIIVYVTPTPGATAVSTAQPTETATAIPPTNTPVPPSATAVPPTSTPTNTPIPPTDTPVPPPTNTIDAQDFGPLIGTDYVLPTQPPPPTAAPPEVQGQAELPEGALDPAFMGIQIDANRQRPAWAYAMDRTSQLGVGWVKLQVNWNNYQRESVDQPPGPAMEELSDLLNVAEERGINVLVSVAKAPPWARSTDVEDGPPDDPQVLADFIVWLFNQRSGFTIDAIEIWNEPNLAREWRGQPLSGQSYMRYFDAGYQAVKSVAPQVRIVTAGLAPTGDTSVSRDDRTYLREMYAAGLGNYTDVAIGVHPYGWSNAPDARCCNAIEGRGWDDDPHFFFLENVDDYSAIMRDNGHGERQMWVTEFGWSTWDGYPGAPAEEWQTYLNRWDQGNFILRAFEIGQSRPEIGVMFLWNLNFGTQRLVDGRDERAGFSIMPELVDGSPPRPAFWMIYDVVRPDETLDSYERN